MVAEPEEVREVEEEEEVREVEEEDVVPVEDEAGDSVRVDVELEDAQEEFFM